MLNWIGIDSESESINTSLFNTLLLQIIWHSAVRRSKCTCIWMSIYLSDISFFEQHLARITSNSIHIIYFKHATTATLIQWSERNIWKQKRTAAVLKSAADKFFKWIETIFYQRNTQNITLSFIWLFLALKRSVQCGCVILTGKYTISKSKSSKSKGKKA